MSIDGTRTRGVSTGFVDDVTRGGATAAEFATNWPIGDDSDRSRRSLLLFDGTTICIRAERLNFIQAAFLFPPTDVFFLLFFSLFVAQYRRHRGGRLFDNFFLFFFFAFRFPTVFAKIKIKTQNNNNRYDPCNQRVTTLENDSGSSCDSTNAMFFRVRVAII